MVLAGLTATHYSEHDVVEPHFREASVMAVKTCVSCSIKVEGYSPKAGNVKCDSCRTTPTKHKRHQKPVEGKVRCEVCGIVRKRLQRHLKTAHDMDVEAYRKAHSGAEVEVPGTRTRSPEARRKQAEAARRRWSSKEERRKQSERLKEAAPWKGKTFSPEHRKAISEGGKGVSHNLSEEERKRRGRAGRLALERVRNTPEFREALSQGTKRRYREAAKSGELIGFQNPETWQKGFDTRISNGNFPPQGSGRGICGFRKGLDHYCRSTLEANFARILTHEGIPYEHEPTLFRLPSGRHYTPEFKLYDPFLHHIPSGWVELKGWKHADGSLPGDADDKIKEFEELTGDKVFVLTQHDSLWKVIERVYSEIIDLWELPRRNLKTHPGLFGRDS